MKKKYSSLWLALFLMAFVLMAGGCNDGGDTVYLSPDAPDNNYPGNPPDTDFDFLEGSWELRDMNTVYMDNPVLFDGLIACDVQLLEANMDIHIISTEIRLDEDLAVATITLRDKFTVSMDYLSNPVLRTLEKTYSFDTLITGYGNGYSFYERFHENVVDSIRGDRIETTSFNFGISIISGDTIRVSEATQRPIGFFSRNGVQDVSFNTRFRMER